MKAGDPVWVLATIGEESVAQDECHVYLPWRGFQNSETVDRTAVISPADAWLPALAAVVREVGPEVVATWLSNSATRLEFDGLSIAAGYMRRLAAALEVK